ncbi:hypothetical protein ACN2C7_13875 [Caulobacter sp. ErkDOM-E]|uniref:hypothetical protein n=1 Tax=Caulobacter sp. ErkDOM-E TaxID=3402778 RepID=UPI003AF911FE
MIKSKVALIAGLLLIALAGGNIGYGICILAHDLGGGAPFLGIGGALLGVAGALLARVKLQKDPSA